jgi:hypothetical protein
MARWIDAGEAAETGSRWPLSDEGFSATPLRRVWQYLGKALFDVESDPLSCYESDIVGCSMEYSVVH